MIFLGLSHYSSLSRYFSNLPSEDGHVTQLGPIRCNGRSGGKSWRFFLPWLKESTFQLFFFFLVHNTSWRALDLWQTSCKYKVKSTKMETHHVKDVRAEIKNLPPRWHSWTPDSVPVTTYLWAFWANKPPALEALSVEGCVPFQLKAFLIDTFQSYIGQTSEPLPSAWLPPWFRCSTVQGSWNIQSPPLWKFADLLSLSFWSRLLPPPIKRTPFPSGCCTHLLLL